MSVLHKKSARLRDEERARLIWLLSTDKAVTSALLGKLTLAERYDEGTLADDLAEVEMLVSHLPPPDLADALEALPMTPAPRCGAWCPTINAAKCCWKLQKTSGATSSIR
jgi:magnesium transporter